MTKVTLISFLAFFLCISCDFSAQTRTPVLKENKTSFVSCTPSLEPFVLIEFFSYEGCKNCAQAEELMNSLMVSAKQQQANVVVLSQHISFWNKLEWNDIYGLPEVDSIQKIYCKKFSSQVYTPQLVVNGQVLGVPVPDFIQKNISFFLKQPVSTGICIEKHALDTVSRTFTMGYRLHQISPQATIHFVLVEGGIVSSITEGDNAGKILHHENTVRAFKFKPIDKIEGDIVWSIPKEINLSKAGVYAYIKNNSSAQIIGLSKYLPIL